MRITKRKVKRVRNDTEKYRENIERKREKADNTKIFAKRLLHLILISIGRDWYWENNLILKLSLRHFM